MMLSYLQSLLYYHPNLVLGMQLAYTLSELPSATTGFTAWTLTIIQTVAMQFYYLAKHSTHATVGCLEFKATFAYFHSIHFPNEITFQICNIPFPIVFLVPKLQQLILNEDGSPAKDKLEKYLAPTVHKIVILSTHQPMQKANYSIFTLAKVRVLNPRQRKTGLE